MTSSGQREAASAVSLVAARAQSPYMTVKQTATYLNTTENALRVAMTRRANHLPTQYRFGRRVLFKRAEVEACVRPVEH